METKTNIIIDDLGFPEGPRWRNNKLWFSDFRMKRVMTLNLKGHLEHIVKVSGQPSGLGWHPDGDLLVVSMVDRCLLKFNGTNLKVFSDLSKLASSYCNDMVVSKEGNAYIGNFGHVLFQEPFRPAELILVTPNGEAKIVARDLAFPNGSVITADGKTLIVAETLAARLTAFDINSDGTLKNRRIWAKFDDLGVITDQRQLSQRIVPDGICLNAEGSIWIASPNIKNQLVCTREGGDIVRIMELKRTPYACMLGGTDRKTLYIATSRMDSIGNLGCIEILQVDIPGDGFP
ncbi:MAG: SMP-30/gluconolactonase/LRE family protein [Candidatus Lokiarchaeota archaeon]|nr:SMP-30/gluconolactonase/LRE family protein [Candidatus Lokiarchaeota archaeon]